MNDTSILRELARKVAEIAALPIQKETIALWKANNSLKPVRPMIMIDQLPWHEMDVDCELRVRCTDPLCQGFETELRRTLYRWNHMRADFVVEAKVDVQKTVRDTGFGVEKKKNIAKLDDKNDVVGQAFIDQMQTDADIEKIHAPEFALDEEATARDLARAHEIFDGLLEVKPLGVTPWYAPWDIIVQWRNPEALLFDIADRPEFLHQLAQKLTDAHLAMLERLESQGLLAYGMSWVHCTGAFTDELPSPGYNPERPRAKDLWTMGMSQIFSSVSPAMHEEFELPYLAPWYERFGLGYYGCCEPLDQKMPMVRKIPNVRKVSMSPWVEVERGAAAIGRDFVFSSKPAPAFLAKDDWHPEQVTRELRQIRDACRRNGCALELILKDISTTRYQPRRVWEWAEIAEKIVKE